MDDAVDFELEGEIVLVLHVDADVVVRVGEVDRPHPIILCAVSAHSGQRLILHAQLTAVLIDVPAAEDKAELAVVLHYERAANVGGAVRVAPCARAQAALQLGVLDLVHLLRRRRPCNPKKPFD